MEELATSSRPPAKQTRRGGDAEGRAQGPASSYPMAHSVMRAALVSCVCVSALVTTRVSVPSRVGAGRAAAAPVRMMAVDAPAKPASPIFEQIRGGTQMSGEAKDLLKRGEAFSLCG